MKIKLKVVGLFIVVIIASVVAISLLNKETEQHKKYCHDGWMTIVVGSELPAENIDTVIIIEDGLRFTPSDAISRYFLEKTLYLQIGLTMNSKSIFIDNNIFKVEPDGGECQVAILNWNPPDIDFAVNISGYSGLAYNTTYTWWTNATDSEGNFISEKYNFTTEKFPTIFCELGGFLPLTSYNIILDGNKTTQISNGDGLIHFNFVSTDYIHRVVMNITGATRTNQTFYWDKVDGAIMYALQLTRDFTTYINITDINEYNYPSTCSINETTVSYTIEIEYGTYFYRISAKTKS